MNRVFLLDIDKLKCHEQVGEEGVAELEKEILDDGLLRRPIIVAKDSLVILDGHHRYQVLKRMGIKKIPVQLVDYGDGEVKVYLRRKQLIMGMIKELVVKRANEGKPFPSKTTRHLIKKRMGPINYPLKKLRRTESRDYS